MKKLDEIMELMSDEMADFKENVGQLQLLNKELKKKSIPISTAALDTKLQEFFLQQNKMNQEKDQAILDIRSQLEKAKVIPKITILLSCIYLVVSILLLIYLILIK